MTSTTDARALWAVRVLDAYVAQSNHGHRTYQMWEETNGTRYCRVWSEFGSSKFDVEDLNSFDAARIAAAERLVASDPTLEPK